MFRSYCVHPITGWRVEADRIVTSFGKKKLSIWQITNVLLPAERDLPMHPLFRQSQSFDKCPSVFIVQRKSVAVMSLSLPLILPDYFGLTIIPGQTIKR